MKSILALAVMGIMILFGTPIHAEEGSQIEPSDNTQRILIAFFSMTNNTKTMAEQIHSLIGGDMFHVITKKPYPTDYGEILQAARLEFDNNERPELATTISSDDVEKYDVIFVGFPIWYGTMPMAMFSFLEQYDLSGKTIVPFCTFGGGSPGRSVSDIAELFPNATILKELGMNGNAMHSRFVSRTRNDVADWLRELGYIR